MSPITGGQALSVDLIGLEELMEKVKPEFLEKPVREFMERATVEVNKQVQILTPVDTGRLRQSIHRDIAAEAIPSWGMVSTNVFYAPYVEMGTRPHFPPPSALATWAGTHGFDSPWPLARTIAARGTKAVHMFARGLEASKAKIDGLLKDAEKKILKAWNK